MSVFTGSEPKVDSSPETKTIAGKRYRLTVDQFGQMIDAGVFPEGHRVELLDGILVDKMTKHEPHSFALAVLGDDIRRMLPESWVVREEKAVVLGKRWRPETDLAIVRGPHGNYRTASPQPVDIGLLIEASDSSYAKDRGAKWMGYAAAGVPAYWIVNIPAKVLEVYTEPAGRGRSATYRKTAAYRQNDSVPLVLDGQEVGSVLVRCFPD